MTAGSFRTFLLTSPRPQGDRLCVCPQDTPFTDLTGGCKDSQVTWCAFACQTPELGGVTWRQRRHQPPVWVRAAGGAGPVPEAGSLRRGASLSPSVSDLGAVCVFMNNTCPWTPGHVAGSPVSLSGHPNSCYCHWLLLL